ncbi:MAG TPA: hypothetical protein VJ910_02845 [Desulfuromonadales bacterium]|nr:hypothetical protein [Desulfuromonadales bacterium]
MTISKPNSLNLRVECYAGYRGEETPRRFSLGERRIQVEAVIDRWLGPDHRYFKLQGDDGGLYILRHASQTGRWDMVMYQAGLDAPTVEDRQEPESLQ